jgi:hypothetical protein
MRSLCAMGSKKLSHHTHPIVFELKQQLWDLKTAGFYIKLVDSIACLNSEK